MEHQPVMFLYAGYYNMPTVGKNTNSTRIAGVLDATPTPAANYRFFLPGAQPVGSGAVLDKSGNGNNGLIEAGTSDAAVWANVGSITTTSAATGTGAGVSVPAVNSLSPMGFDLANGKSLLWALQVKIPTNPTGSALRVIAGSLTGASGGIVLYMGEASAAFAGRVTVRIRNAGGTNNTYNTPTTAPLINDGNIHSVVVFVNGTNKTLTVYVDGTASAYQNAQDISAIAATVQVPNSGYGLGHYGDPSATGTLGTQTRNHHCLIFDTLPSNINSIVQHVVKNPTKVVENWMIK